MIDPFTVLSVDRGASKKEILQQAAQVLRERRLHNARTVAEAQKMLFSPMDRAEAEFIHCQNSDFMEISQPGCPVEGTVPALDLLELFDEEGTPAQ